MQVEALAQGNDPEAIATLEAIPPLPRLAAYVWNWWLELAETRTSNGFSPNPITREDIHRWEADTFHRLRSWERRAILRIDTLWRASVQPAPP